MAITIYRQNSIHIKINGLNWYLNNKRLITNDTTVVPVIIIKTK